MSQINILCLELATVLHRVLSVILKRENDCIEISLIIKMVGLTVN